MSEVEKIGAWAAMKYLVPMARANRYACERLAEAIAHHQFSTGEVAEIYAAWRQGPLYVQNSIINDPKLFLRAGARSNRKIRLPLNRPRSCSVTWTSSVPCHGEPSGNGKNPPTR